jgi:mannose-6-phosphate isomerase-like protein (cupin superfamily)
MITKSSYLLVQVCRTKDGSEVRELMHPAIHGSRKQSLAEATVHPGLETHLHIHRRAEEIYHVTAGAGLMTVGPEQFPVQAGDTVCIPPNTPHCIRNTGACVLKILCCSSPAYSHEDTELLGCSGSP